MNSALLSWLRSIGTGFNGLTVVVLLLYLPAFSPVFFTSPKQDSKIDCGGVILMVSGCSNFHTFQ